jgi:sulfur carrier protein ThiS
MTTQEDLSNRLEKARQNAESLRSRLERRRFELEDAQKKVNECKKQGEALGVSSPEELRALIEKTQAEDQRAIAEVEAAIVKAATALRDIEAQAQSEGN